MSLRRSESRLPLLAGWLFADLFLVLFMIVLGLAPAEQPGASSTPPTTTTSSPEPTTTTPPKPEAPTLDRTPISLFLSVDVSQLQGTTSETERLVTLVRQELTQRGLGDRRVGFIMGFAPGPKSDIAAAQAQAMDAIRVVRAGIPTFADAADPGEGYWSGASSQLELKVFFYA